MLLKQPVRVLLVVLLISSTIFAEQVADTSARIISLDEMTVHDRTEVEKLKSSAVNMSIIEGKDLVGRSVSLTDVLDRVAGVKVRSAGGVGGGQRISIRGLEGKRVRIFIDEAPITALDGILGLDDLPVQLIERVEIYKGVIPAKFGSDALGGAINIVTVSRVFSYADFTYKPSSYNTHQGMLLSKLCRPNGFYAGFGGIINYSDNNYPMNLNSILNRNDPGLKIVKRDHDKYRNNLVGMSLGKWDGWFDDIGVEIVYTGANKEIQGIKWPVNHAHTYSHTGIIAPYAEKNDFLIQGLQFDFGLGLVASLSSLIDTASTATYDWLGSPSPTLQGETDIYSKHNTRDTLVGGQARLTLEYTLNPNHRIDLNNMFQLSDFTPFDDKGAKQAHVMIARYPARVTNDVLNTGYDLKLIDGRLNNYLSAKLFMQKVTVDTSGVNSNENLMGKDTTTSVNTIKGSIGNALSFKLATPVTLYASYQHGVRLPDKQELFGEIGVEPSLGLKPETSENVTIGCNILVKRIDEFLPRFEFELSGFSRFTDNMIKLEPGLTAAKYKNIDKVRTLGFEADVKTDLFPWLYVTSNITFQDMIYLESIKEPYKEGKRLANQPWLFGNAGVELSKKDLVFTNSVAKLFWEADYTYEYYTAVKVVKTPKDMIPSQFLQNIGLQYSWNNALDVGFEIHNIADVEAYDLYKIPLPGRSWHIILHYFMKSKRFN